MAKPKQMSENFILGIILAAVGGYLDAYTYLVRGGVFANAQTGNIVLLGINLAEGSYLNALQYLFPIAAFSVGVLELQLDPIYGIASIRPIADIGPYRRDLRGQPQ